MKLTRVSCILLFLVAMAPVVTHLAQAQQSDPAVERLIAEADALTAQGRQLAEWRRSLESRKAAGGKGSSLRVKEEVRNYNAALRRWQQRRRSVSAAMQRYKQASAAEPRTTRPGQQGLRRNAAALTQTAGQLARDPKYQPRGGNTYCNFFVQDFARQAFGYVPNEMRGMANQIYDKLDRSSTWKSWSVRDDPQRAFQNAQQSANQGKLVVVATKNPSGHGHVAIVVPSRDRDGGMSRSGHWKTKVPWIAQAGKSVFAYDKLSYGFSPEKKQSMQVFIHP